MPRRRRAYPDFEYTLRPPQSAFGDRTEYFMNIFDENQEALLTARDHQTILAALRFWRAMVLSPDTPSPDRVLAEVIPIAAAAGTPLSLGETEALISRMDGLRVGAVPKAT